MFERWTTYMRKSKYVPAVLLALTFTACQNGTETTDDYQSKMVEGYGELKFGMSFDEVISVTGLKLYNPVSLQNCLRDRSIRGCLLIPRNNLITYQTVEGISYGLGLAFNKFDRLTDIELNFIRRTIDDPSQRISIEDCLSIYQRTADWIVKEYGPFDLPSSENQKISSNEITAAGTKYSIYRSSKTTFLANNYKNFSNRRKLSVFSFAQPDSCEVSVKWEEPENVERYELSADQKAKLEELTSSTK